MGLDVYVRWEGMTKEDEQAQCTGFQTVGSAGYLRQSWGSLEAWDNVFNAAFSKSWSSFLAPSWKGFNDEQFKINEDNRQKLEEGRNILEAFVNNPFQPADENLKKYFSEESWENRAEIISSQCKEMIAFINLALNKPNAEILFR